MIDEKKIFNKKHSLLLENKTNLTLTGIIDVLSFDEELIVSQTSKGVLIIKGIDLHITKMNVENGDMTVEGDVMAINYESDEFLKGKTRKMFGNIFK